MQSFIKGKNIDDLSKIHNCTNITISRNLKKSVTRMRSNQKGSGKRKHI